MRDKITDETVYRDRTYEKELVNDIIRHLQTHGCPSMSLIYLEGILEKYGSRWSQAKIPPDILTWIKYLLSHPQSIYYYRRQYRF